MRRTALLGIVGLAFLVVAAAGCASPPGNPPPPMQVRGVVEIFRVDPAKPPGDPGVTVGFVSVDPADVNVIWWLLADKEEPPVMPADIGNVLRWVKRSSECMSGSQLCTQFGSKLPGGKVWRVYRDAEPPTECK